MTRANLRRTGEFTLVKIPSGSEKGKDGPMKWPVDFRQPFGGS